MIPSHWWKKWLLSLVLWRVLLEFEELHSIIERGWESTCLSFLVNDQIPCLVESVMNIDSHGSRSSRSVGLQSDCYSKRNPAGKILTMAHEHHLQSFHHVTTDKPEDLSPGRPGTNHINLKWTLLLASAIKGQAEMPIHGSSSIQTLVLVWNADFSFTHTQDPE